MITNYSKQYKSDFISFLKGFSSAFDISAQTFMGDIPDFSGGFERDARVLRGDWERVGNDLRKAMGQISYGQQNFPVTKKHIQGQRNEYL